MPPGQKRILDDPISIWFFFIVTKSKLELFAVQQTSESRDQLLVQEIVTLFGKKPTKKMVDLCSKQPSCLS